MTTAAARMTTAAARAGINNKNWMWIGFGGIGLILLVAAVCIPNLNRARYPAGAASNRVPAHEYSPADKAVADGALVSPSLSQGSAVRRLMEPNMKAVALPSSDRRIIRTSSMELTVKSPAQAAEDMRRLAEGFGGYLESMQVDGSKDAPTACVTIRIPATRFEDAKSKIRTLAFHVENEKTDAKDVTKEYVDSEARLRNLRAEEAQYLQIMKRANKVDDMLNVSEKLSEVRGQIEQQQAEFEALSKQVEMVAIAVSARVQPGPEAFGVNWQPLRQFRLAGRDALEGLAQYASSMIAVILYLPVVLLWLGTVTLGLVGSWKVLQWITRTFFTPPTAIEAAKPA